MPDVLQRAHPAAVVFCFLFSGDRVLLVRRLLPPHEGTITVPGGRKERGETPCETCIREMLEETGMAVSSPRFRGMLYISAGEKETAAFYYSSRDFSGDLRGSEEGMPFWCRKEESISLDGANPFFTLLAPRIFCEFSPIFEGKVLAGEGGAILASSFRSI